MVNIEFVYVKRENKTVIYIWNGMTLKDTLEKDGKLSYSQKKEIRIKLSNKY